MTQEEFHRYLEREVEFRIAIKRLEGEVLRDVLLQVIEPEINLVVLITDSGPFSLQGAVGGELLQMVDAGPGVIDGEHSWYERFEAASPFIGSRIAQSRVIGETWNGHGLELSFESHPDETLVVQSIYAGSVPDGFNDCLRIGVTKYIHERVRLPTA